MVGPGTGLSPRCIGLRGCRGSAKIHSERVMGQQAETPRSPPLLSPLPRGSLSAQLRGCQQRCSASSLLPSLGRDRRCHFDDETNLVNVLEV